MASSTPAKTKYSGFLDGRKAPAEPLSVGREGDTNEEPSNPALAVAPKAGTAREKAKGKAKTQDKRFKGYTLLLKIETHTDANSILKKRELHEGEAREDLSDLTERLLAAWVEENQQKRSK